MQQQPNDELAKIFIAITPELDGISADYVSCAVGLIKERASFVDDFWSLSHFFFETPLELNEKAAKKAWKEDSPLIMNELIGVVKSCEDFSAEILQEKTKAWIASNGIGFGKVMMPLRLALVGDLKGPDVFQIMFMIGEEETIRRIENIINTLKID